MTVAELMNVLRGLDGSELICVDTTYWSPCGIYPAADKLSLRTVQRCDEEPPYHAVVLKPSKWPPA